MVPELAAGHEISLLIADVDGTLLTREKLLTKRAIQAVHQLHERSIRVAVTSGRPPRGMTMLVQPLQLAGPIAGFNGGMLVQPDLTIIERHDLPDDVLPETIALLESHGLDVWLYRGNDWLIRQREAPHVDREEWTVQFPPTVVTGFDGLLDQVTKVVGVSDDLGAVARCEQAARDALGSRVSAARSQPYYLDVTHPLANKGTVVRSLSSRLGVPTERIATIGDQPSDLPMFKASGLSIAMGNASDEVKGYATYVTRSNDDEGFADAVERFILRR